MATNTNEGDQIISFDYKQLAKGEGFNAINYRLHERGVYTGFSVSILDNATVRLSTGIILVEDTSKSLSVHCRTKTNVDVTVNSANVYVVARFIWLNAEENYVAFLSLDYASILADDVILGRCIYPDGVNLTYIDTNVRTDALRVLSDIDFGSFKCLATEPITSSVSVTGGEAIINGKYVNFSTDIISIPDTVLGRITVVAINDSGSIQLIEGTDSSTPVSPLYPADVLVVAEINRGASRTNVFGSDIKNLAYVNNKIMSSTDIFVNLNGDTMTGTLIINSAVDNQLKVQNSTLDADSSVIIDTTGDNNKSILTYNKNNTPFWETYCDTITNTNNFKIKNISTANDIVDIDTSTDVFKILTSASLSVGVAVDTILNTSSGSSSSTLLTESAIFELTEQIVEEVYGDLYISTNNIIITDSVLNILGSRKYKSQTIVQDITALSTDTWYFTVIREDTLALSVIDLATIDTAIPSWTPDLAQNKLDMLGLYDETYKYCRFNLSTVDYKILYAFKTNSTPNNFEGLHSPIKLLGKPFSHIFISESAVQSFPSLSATDINVSNIELDLLSEVTGASSARTYVFKTSCEKVVRINACLGQDATGVPNVFGRLIFEINGETFYMAILGNPTPSVVSYDRLDISKSVYLTNLDSLKLKVIKESNGVLTFENFGTITSERSITVEIRGC